MSLAQRAVVISLYLIFPTIASAQVGSLADGTLVGWGFIGAPPAGTFTAVDAGNGFAIAVRADGSLVGWGTNTGGQTLVPAGTYTAVAAGFDHGVAIRTDGGISGWGTNNHGQGSAPPGAYSAIDAGAGFTLALRTDGTLAGFGYNDLNAVSVPTGTFKAVAAGRAHGLGIRTDGTVAGWGFNGDGQTNVPAGTFSAIAGGLSHSLAVRTDGTLAGWGWNQYGQTNVPTGVFTAVAGGDYHSIGLRADGTLAGWGLNSLGETSVPGGVFTAITAGNSFSLGIRAINDFAGDLLVSGTGSRAYLNRNVTVAGNTSILSPMTSYNNPTLVIGGKLTFGGNGEVQGNGLFATAGGIQILPGTTAQLSGDLTINSAGPLTGPGSLNLNGAHLTAAMSNALPFTGALTIDAGSLAFTGPGVINPASLAIAAEGELRLGGAQRMFIGDSRNSNRGKIEAIGNFAAVGGNSELESRGSFTNDKGATLTTRVATLRFTGGLTNAGDIITGPGFLDLHGVVTNSGNILVTGGGVATFHHDVAQNGSLNVSKSGSTTSVAIFLGRFSGKNGVTGAGDVFMEGELTPGNSPAAVPFGGNLHLGPASTTRIELAGKTPGTQYDQLNVTQTATLAGTLAVSLLNNFNPAPLDPFTAMTFAQRNRTFDHYSGMDLPGPLTLAPVYSTTNLKLIATIPGDANTDGRVDFADLVARAQHYGGTDTLWPTGDFSYDGATTFTDLVVWAQHYGASISPAEIATLDPIFAVDAQRAFAQVPEPGSLGFTSVVGVLLLRRRR